MRVPCVAQDGDSGLIARVIAPYVFKFDPKRKAVIRFLSAHLRAVAAHSRAHQMGCTWKRAPCPSDACVRAD